MEILGWRERLGMPSLGIDKIVAKVDTGARTSSLDATGITRFEKSGKTYVRFTVNPGGTQAKQDCVAPLVEMRDVTDSGGHVEQRFVILTELQINETIWSAEITLTNRGTMKYRMLLGRSALRKRFQVDPSKSFLSLNKSVDGHQEITPIGVLDEASDCWPYTDEEEE